MDPLSDISKSRRKRDMHALQAIGEELIALPKDRLARLNLPDNLREAVHEARRLHQRGARRRQIQYVGRLMRDVDADDIQKQLEASGAGSAQEVAVLHRAERWRERLLSDENTLSEFVDAFPGVDVQKLRTTLRNTKLETAAGKPPRSFRTLFQEIRQAMKNSDADMAMKNSDEKDDAEQ
jgi:ribosome-associated protein